MQIKALKILNFKNYKQAQLLFHDKVNCFTGLNGAGKTNLLDAIYFIAFTKSFLGNNDLQCINFNEFFFSIEADLNKNGLQQKVYLVQNSNERKQLKFNNNPVKKFSDYIGNIPLIIIAPGDILLPLAPSEDRRKFVDAFISQFNKVYLNNLLTYNKTLEHRNKLLKDFYEKNYFNETLLAGLNEQLVLNGNYIYEQRKIFINEVAPLLIQHYKNISSSNEEVNILYESSLNQTNFSDLLMQSVQNDLSSGRTTQGIHKDDLLFYIHGNLLKKFGSQGQQKSYLIALKLAMYDLLAQKKQIKPLLIIDDMLEKLDAVRIDKLVNLINNNFFGQVFISHTDKDVLIKLFERNNIDAKFFTVENGRIID
ncbi:MAG: DNA replication/repair protein RecF [Bacteroidia bacterium]